MVRIAHKQCIRIAKNSRGLLKRNPVFPAIQLRLLFIPNEFHKVSIRILGKSGSPQYTVFMKYCNTFSRNPIYIMVLYLLLSFLELIPVAANLARVDTPS